VLKIVVGAILGMAGSQAQKAQPLLLPEARHIAGVVVDAQGKPVAEASVDHTYDQLHAHKTDPEGRFELDTRASAVVVRKAGYRSEVIRTMDATQVRVTLRKLDRAVFPACSAVGRYEGIDGWEASFQFQNTPGIIASPQVRDADYGARDYYVDTENGRGGIRHGSGALWSFGVPLDEDVWQSVAYEEIVFENGALTIIDARGQFPNGTRWRQLGKFGETASYSDVDEATAKSLDRFLDGACLKSTSVK
jgi:hypothetical protein